MEKIDRRVKRTHKFLADALVTLALEKGYDAVTIRDITEHADISYSTFFRHYPDKDSLLISMMENVVAELRELLQDQQATSEGGEILFRHVAENHDLYCVLLGGLNSSAMVMRVQAMIVAEALRDSANRPEGAIPTEIAANHVAASSLALVKWWLDNDMPYPPERMGSFYHKLVMQPVD